MRRPKRVDRDSRGRTPPSVRERLTPDSVTDAGARCRRVGQPFRVTTVGHRWIACLFPDGKMRPVRADQLKPLEAGQ